MNVPVVTYRLQFNSDFTFDSASEILTYLNELGISHIYASPILKVKKGSQHCYDVVDPVEINPELGGRDKLIQLFEKAKDLNLSWLQDIVPNHMAFDSENKLLMDIFEKGIASRFYKFFDIDWNHPYLNLRGKALAPFLAEFYGACLEKKEILLCIGENGFFIKYNDLKLPVFLLSYPDIFKACLEDVMAKKENDSSREQDKINNIIKLFDGLSGNMGNNSAIADAKTVLWRDYSSDEAIRQIIDGFVDRINNGNNESLEALHRLISEQLFRLSFWKVGNNELNYRRFFSVNSLICLKTEDADVFDYIHSLTLDLVNKGYIEGLRVDHIDGLYAPLIYLRRLKEKAQNSYIVIEKIFCINEEMPATWPVQGTTGYDFLNYVNGVFVDTGAEQAMKKIYTSFSEMHADFESLVVEKKKLFMGKHMAGDIDNLALLLKNIFSNNRYGSDFTMYGLRRALVEIMAHFPVYRTYASELGLGDSDKFYITRAIEKARRTGQDLVYELNSIEKVFSLDFELKLNDDEKELCRHFSRRFQQFSGALMAKGAEDTAAYIYNRLISQNEVGGFPDKFGMSIDEYHAFNIKRFKLWPYSMNTTATHDTKRGEDIRVRIDFLSEIPLEWHKAIKLWNKMNRHLKTKIDKKSAPSNNDEYFIYQTLAGAFPFNKEESGSLIERMKQYIVKAVREAKIHTAWIKPDVNYENACTKFVEEMLSPSENNPFLNSFIPFQKKVAYFGIFNSLSQILLKLTSPGVPDIYRGTELWDFNLVDPDNRRLVDFEKRKIILSCIREKERDVSMLIKELIERKEDGSIKLFTIYRILKARRQFKDLFQNGEYIQLQTDGMHKNNIIAFARQSTDSCCIVIAPRFLSKVVQENELPLGTRIWQDTSVALPEGFSMEWENVITGNSCKAGENILMGDCLDIFPLCLLIAKKQNKSVVPT